MLGTMTLVLSGADWLGILVENFQKKRNISEGYIFRKKHVVDSKSFAISVVKIVSSYLTLFQLGSDKFYHRNSISRDKALLE